VETPGTAPGSEPLITRAFIAVVPKNTANIAIVGQKRKGLIHSFDDNFDHTFGSFENGQFSVEAG